jgi:hypothetical protein
MAISVYLCLFLSIAAWAQQARPDPAALLNTLDKQVAPVVSAWLKSDDPRMQAWGAFLALRDRRAEAVPRLLEMMANYPAAEEHDAMLEVLDALIQLGAQAPVADAQRMYPEFPVQSLILLSRAKEEATPALFSFFKAEGTWPVAWLASGNLLFQRRARGFSAAVIEGMTVHAQVVVRDPGARGGTGGSASCCGARSPAESKDGWPPVGVYEFGGCGDSLGMGDTVLVPGADPATYRREVNTTYKPGYGLGCGCNLDRDLVRQHYLTALTGNSADDPPMRAHVAHTIVWQSPNAYRRDLAAFIAAQQTGFAALTQRLGELSLLSEEPVDSLRPALHIVIGDQRTLQEPPLPPIGQLAANVTIERQ